MTEEVNPISNMIDYITQSEFQKANDVFNDLLGQRVSDSLEQEKIAIAQSMHSDEDEDTAQDTIEVDEDDVELEVSDEEMQDALDELEDEEVEV